jgi:sugar phosphate isomerase/epimerase
MLHISSTAFDADILTPDGAGVARDFPGLELSGGPHRSPAELSEGMARLRRAGAASILVHNYFPPPKEPFVLNLATADAILLERCLRLAGEALDLCAALGTPFYSFHPGYRRDGRELSNGHFAFSGPQRSMSATLAQFHANFPALHALACERGVKLAVENLFPIRDEVTSLANTLGEMEALIAPLPGDVGLLLDLGHLAVSANLLGFDRLAYLDGLLSRHGGRIFEVHLSGNDGETDAHLPIQPGDWQLDVLPLFRGLPGADGNGVRLTLESRRLHPDLLRKTAQLFTSRL